MLKKTPEHTDNILHNVFVSFQPLLFSSFTKQYDHCNVEDRPSARRSTVKLELSVGLERQLAGVQTEQERCFCIGFHRQRGCVWRQRKARLQTEAGCQRRPRQVHSACRNNEVQGRLRGPRQTWWKCSFQPTGSGQSSSSNGLRVLPDCDDDRARMRFPSELSGSLLLTVELAADCPEPNVHAAARAVKQLRRFH